VWKPIVIGGPHESVHELVVRATPEPSLDAIFAFLLGIGVLIPEHFAQQFVGTIVAGVDEPDPFDKFGGHKASYGLNVELNVLTLS